MYNKILSKIKNWSNYHRQMRRAKKRIKAYNMLENSNKQEVTDALLNIIHDYREELKTNDKRN